MLRLGEGSRDAVLLGSRCSLCERYFFPQRRRCAACAAESTATTELSTTGVLVGFTSVTKKPLFSVLEPPYLLGEVLLPEGVRVYSTINVAGGPQPSIGSPVRLEPVEVQLHEGPAIAYNFTVEVR